ncbi:MAG: hypothetical protein IKO91_00655 [Oscillospiraceae bacterium]|nr:hypothetical protein [Oscillospiraceae bacterium]
MAGYRGKFFIRRRVWRCGPYAEVELYPVFQPPGRRRAKCRPTKECQQRINQRDAEKKLGRIVKANFSERDLEADLTFAGDEGEAAARKALGKWLRELRKLYRAAGTELRYLYVWETGKKSGKAHFHVILNAGPLSRDEVEDLWPHGSANCRRLRMDEKGLSGLVEYITKRSRSGRRTPGKRRWSGSRNLTKPEPEVRDGAATVGEVMALAEDIDRRNVSDVLLPGMTLVEAEAMRNRVNKGLYVRLELAAPETWHGRRPVARYLSGDLGEVEE